MAAPDEALTLAGGYLIQDPTDLGTSQPFGGTVLGTIQSAALVPTYRVEPIVAEETAEDADGIYMGQEWVLTAILRNYDADGMAAIFPNVTTSGGRPILSYPGSTRVPGSLWSDQAMILYLAPFESTHPGIILYNAVPRPDAERINFGAYDDWAVRCTWVGLRDASERVGVVAQHQDHSL